MSNNIGMTIQDAGRDIFDSDRHAFRFHVVYGASKFRRKRFENRHNLIEFQQRIAADIRKAKLNLFESGKFFAKKIAIFKRSP